MVEWFKCRYLKLWIANYASVHQIRNIHKGGEGGSVYIHKNFEFKIRNDLSINCEDIESIGAELLYEKTRNTLFNVVYKPPNSKIEPFENFLKILFNKNENSNKNYHIAENFNLNLLDHDKSMKKGGTLYLLLPINHPTAK